MSLTQLIEQWACRSNGIALNLDKVLNQWENIWQVDLTEIGGKGVSVASLLHLCSKEATVQRFDR